MSTFSAFISHRHQTETETLKKRIVAMLLFYILQNKLPEETFHTFRRFITIILEA
jgi:hypothetical protein